MNESIGALDVVASFALVALVVGLSFWRKLGLERSILWASARATVQLLAVGFLFTFIFESEQRDLWAWLWVVMMIIVSAVVVTRRASRVPRLFLTALFSLVATTAIVLGVIFGLQILEPDAISIVVMAGITIGNTMPSVVLGANRMLEILSSQQGQLEAYLSLGFGADRALLPFEQEVVRSALTTQIERTRVVGVIALPGAMTGLLLAGIDPVDAVILQLAVMFLVLGSVATSVVIVSRTIARRALTEDLRVDDWVRAS